MHCERQLKLRSHNTSYWQYCLIEVVTKAGLIVVMVFNATFNNISVISWQSILLVKETIVQGENHRPASQVTDKLYHIMLY